MRVSVDLNRCTGHGRCYALCPEVFEEDDAGHCQIVLREIPEALEDRARMAAENCPELAILLED